MKLDRQRIARECGELVDDWGPFGICVGSRGCAAARDAVALLSALAVAEEALADINCCSSDPHAAKRAQSTLAIIRGESDLPEEKKP